MEDASQNSKLVRECVGDFIFKKNSGIKRNDSGALTLPQEISFYKLGGKFIKIEMMNSGSSKKSSRKQKIFRCAYKMMTRFNRSLN
ncbi:hypothetical protein RM549_09520 [Salegentibacter sp. F188]|uniref:Uncharacterized protein n=1 Tax=Autumnicola patrickiae TaxID=3075591 RepID=A0ABU3E220_9FLAO|nr:hypothetical protein [Salegentibacter sp. F188]MDT0690022.1 hypothetical protein [Salegentibacter sp. F188]